MAFSQNISTSFVGKRAPDFSLDCTQQPTEPGWTTRLSDFLDRWLILIFYPQDFSLICPTELTALSDCVTDLAESNTSVLAVSADSIETHERWIATPALKGGLGHIRFPLASDPGGTVAQKFGVYAIAQKVAHRGLFIIDPNSIVQYQSLHNLNVGRSASEIMRVLKALQVGGLCAENWTPGDSQIELLPAVKPGARVAQFRIIRQLGQGGMGAVYLAEDENLKRKVALKLLPPHMTRDPVAKTLFMNEALSAAALSHPNIVTIFDVTEQAGQIYLVFEYMDGKTLHDLIYSNALSAMQALEFARQICKGLEYAHSEGVIHRDLKSSNILSDSSGNVKIGDFGLAMSKNGASYIIDGALMGTLHYQSPESTRGETTDARSDIFSLGVVLYELFCGKLPFTGEYDEAIVYSICNERPDPGHLDSEFSTQLREIIFKALEKDVDARYQSVAALLRGLDSLRDGKLQRL